MTIIVGIPGTLGADTRWEYDRTGHPCYGSKIWRCSYGYLLGLTGCYDSALTLFEREMPPCLTQKTLEQWVRNNYDLLGNSFDACSFIMVSKHRCFRIYDGCVSEHSDGACIGSGDYVARRALTERPKDVRYAVTQCVEQLRTCGGKVHIAHAR